MVAFISSWAQGIIIAVILATILEMILPEGNNKKYIKMIVGVYVLFAIISPIITKFANEEWDLSENLYDKYFKEDIKVSSQFLQQSNEDTISKLYEDNMKANIITRLKERGFHVLQIELQLELEEDTRYGRINLIRLQVEKKEQEQQEVSIVNKIEIGDAINEIGVYRENTNALNNTDTKAKDNTKGKISNAEKKEIETMLMDNYGVEKKRIHINE